MYLASKGKYDKLIEYHLKSLSCVSRTFNPHNLSSCEMHLLIFSSLSTLIFLQSFYSIMKLCFIICRRLWKWVLKYYDLPDSQNLTVIQDIIQGSTGGNKKATIHSRSPKRLFQPESIHFLQRICVKFGAVTIGCQMLQAQTHLIIRDMLKYFPVITPKILSRPPVQHCRRSMTLWSISPCQALNSLNWHLNCIQEQFLLSLIQAGFWRSVFTVERPVLTAYKSQNHSAWYHFSQKREKKHKPVEEEMLAEMQPRDFRESPVKYSIPELADYLPLPRVSLACLR